MRARRCLDDLALGAAVAASCLGSWWVRGLGSRADVPVVLPLLCAWAVVATGVGFVGRVRTVGLILVVAATIRFAWVGAPPVFSDDLFRYLFEGRAAALGHDVFRSAPATLGGVDDALRARVNHPEVPSVYPPLALWWFRLLAVFGTVPSTQLLTAAVDVGTVGLVARFGSRRGALVLALHPLAAIEAAAGAHVDVPAVFLATAALAAHRAGRTRLALAAAALGAWTKLFPAVLGPSLLRPLSWRDRLLAVASGAALGIGLAAPLVDFGPHLFTGVRVYAGTWAFSGFVFPWLSPLLGEPTRAVLAGALVAVFVAVHRTTRDPARVWAVSGTAFVLLSPTVHPWYVLWALVPSLFLGRVEWALAAIGPLLSYRVLSGYDPVSGAWTEVPGLWWLVWGSAAAGAALGAAWTRHEARSDDQPTAP